MSPWSTLHILRSISIRLIYGTLPNDSSLFLGTSFASLPGSQVIDLLHIQNHLQLRLVPLRLPGRRHAQKICSTFGSTAKFSLFLLFHGYLFLPRDLQTHHSHPWNRAHPQPSVELLPEYSSSSWNPNSWSLKSAVVISKKTATGRLLRPPRSFYVLHGVTPPGRTRELIFLRIKAPLLPRGLSGEASEASSWPRSSDSSPYVWMPFRGLDALSVNFQSHVRGRTVSPFKDTWPFNLLQTRNIYITNTSLADGFTLKLCPRRAKKNTGDLFPS